MPSSLAIRQPAPVFPRRARRFTLLMRIVAFAPIWLLIIASIARPVYFEPLFGEYPNILGMNLGVIVEGIALAWMLLGVALLWNPRSPAIEALALTVFTIPATVMVLFSPALVLILLNQG